MSGQTIDRHEESPSKVRVFLYENSIFLVCGAVAALLWANLDQFWHHDTYQGFIHFNLLEMFGMASASEGHGGHGHGISVHFLINDVLMAFFFAIAAKEVWEACQPGGGLSCLKKAATPLIAMAGGLIGPAILYLICAAAFGNFSELSSGWAIPCATDIAFSYLVARLIFGNGHPAIAFLLLLAIADDAVGLIILAVFYPVHESHFTWLLLTLVAMASAYGLRKANVRSFWPYLLGPGALSWTSFYMAGIHPALGLVPVIPFMSVATRDAGIFANSSEHADDTLSQFEHWWKSPVELILGLFALVNAGVVFSSVGAGTLAVTIGLFVGKPVGIAAFTYLAIRYMKFELPEGMTYRDAIVLGFTASLGFTVALFVSTAAFPTPGPIQDSLKMGALLSFFAVVTSFIGALACGVRPACFPKPSNNGGVPSKKSTEGIA